ncbi:MAG: aminopeptidase P family protein [bacterium]|nr:aminopeptidase P family protein [bacterium]
MRLRKLKGILGKNGTFPYLISDLTNIKYLTGFTGSYASLLVDEKKSYFISDSRYEEYAKSILPKGTVFLLQKGELTGILKETLKEMGVKELYLEEHSMTLSNFLQMKKKLRGIKLVPAGDEVNTVRMVKDEEEIRVLKEAAALTDRCVDHLLEYIKPGMLEWEISVEIENFYRNNGCQKTSFETIVASGAGSSMPHYETSMTKKVEKGDVILIDMGCQYKGYNSDLTRTIFMNTIATKIEEIYSIVKWAQESAIESVKPGISTGELDCIARDIISGEGYGEYFGHSLGHGFGLEVHELPAVKKEGEIKLKKNMTITIEPGIYIPGLGGVRIEDMVLVTAKGGEVLTKSSKEIVVIE